MTYSTLTNFRSREAEIQMSLDSSISVVVPAYQEENRIGATLESLSNYLALSFEQSEIIVVCNGCTDRTAEIAASFKGKTRCQIVVLNVPTSGKGSAVKTGVLSAQGNFILFLDADNAYSPELIQDFVAELQAGADVVVAERKKTTKYRSAFRRLLGRVTGIAVSQFLTPGITDTQAGLKAFSAQSARQIFLQQRTRGFAFDIELLMLASRNKLIVRKKIVDWVDCEGSKVRLSRDYLLALVTVLGLYFRVNLLKRN